MKELERRCGLGTAEPEIEEVDEDEDEDEDVRVLSEGPLSLFMPGKSFDLLDRSSFPGRVKEEDGESP